MSRQYLHGRIFDRALKFATLSPEVQEETKACEHYLMEHKEEIFRMHHASPFRTVYSVRGKQLVEVIETWLKEDPVVVNVVPLEVNPVQEDGSPTNPDPVQEDGLPTNPEIEDPVHEDRPPTNPEHEGSELEDGLPTDPENEDPVQEDRPPSDPAQEASVDPDVSNEDHPVVDSNVHVDPSTTSPPIMEAIPSTHPPQPSTVVEELKNRRFHAKELMVAMLCHGFLALHKEWHKEYMYKDLDLYIPVVKELKKDDCILVWEAVENALFAAPIQRKMGLLSRIAHGKENFIVIKEQMIFIYENDTIPSHPLIEWNTSSIKLSVTYDSNQFPHGIKLWNEDITEVLNTRDSMEQDWLMYALVSTGMEYLEPIPSFSSLYTIKEKTLEGQEMDLNQFKGCVLLIVNIASEEDPSSAVQYKELMELHEKYKNDGLIIIGMPCTQFGGTKLNFVEYFQNIGLTFRLLEQGMVNGLMTRPLFSFLKSILRGPNGLFVDWNFTKFVVDRHGVPVRRFEPEETPLMFEDVIVELLSQVPPLEVMEEKVAALEAATQVVESVGEAMLAKEGPEEDVQMVDKAFEMWKEDETSHNTKQMNQEMGPQAVFS